MKAKRIISFLLALVMLAGFIPAHDLAYASNTNGSAEELSYEIVEENGRLYKAYKVSDLNLKDPTRLVRSNKFKGGSGFRAVGDPPTS